MFPIYWMVDREGARERISYFAPASKGRFTHVSGSHMLSTGIIHDELMTLHEPRISTGIGWALGCVNPTSWLRLAVGVFTQPSAHLLDDPCTVLPKKYVQKCRKIWGLGVA